MKNAATAMTWQIWRAQRWGIVLGITYLVICIMVAHYLPKVVTSQEAVQNAGWNLALPCGLILLHWMLIFSVIGSADFQEKGYPGFQFRLPVSTSKLALLPIFLGAASVIALWLIVAFAILRPTHNVVPIFWPMALLVTLMTIVQGISWTPMTQNWLQLVIALPALLVPTAGMIIIAIFQVNEWIAVGSYLVILPLTIWVCVNGVAMARRGDALEWRMAAHLMERVAAWRRPSLLPFASIEAAQFWYEFRMHGRMLPFVVLLVLPMFALMMPLFHRHEVALFWKLLAMMFSLPVLFAATLSAQCGDVPYPFLMTRPIRVAQVFSAKVKMAMTTAVISSTIVLLCSPLYFVRPAMVDSLRTALGAMGPVKSTIVIAAVVIGPPLLTWKLIVENLWLGMAGRSWFTNTCVLVFAGLIGFGTLLGLGISVQPGLQNALRVSAPWIIIVLAALKVALGTWLMREVIRRELLSPRAAVFMLAAWAGAFVGIFSLVLWQGSRLPVGMGVIAAAVALALPLNRLAASPLMFEWNRHR